MQKTYSSVREQLIVLTLDLEDKIKNCNAIEAKIDSLRRSLSHVEADYSAEYNHKIETASAIAKSKMEQLTKSASQLVSEKKKLLDECKQLVDDIKETERQAALLVKRENQDVNDAIEKERKSFRASADERQQKFLASKFQEMKELTLKALQPEEVRIKNRFEIEIADIEQNARTEARKALDDVRHQTQIRMMKEEETIKQEFREKQLERRERNARLESEAESQQRQALAALQSELQADLGILKAGLAKRLQDSQKENALLITYGREELQEKVKSGRAAHDDEMRAVQRDHRDKVEAMQLSYQQAKDALLGAQPRSSSPPSPAHSNRHSGASLKSMEDGLRRAPSGRGHGDSGGMGVEEKKAGGEDDDEVVAAVAAEARRMVESERDHQIQTMIRQLQTESVRLERQWRVKADEESRRVSAATDAELKILNQKLRRMTDDIAELVADKEMYLKEMKVVTDRVDEVQLEATRVTEEAARCDAELADVRRRICKQREEQASMRLQEQQSQREMKEDLEQRLLRARTTIERRERDHEHVLAQLHKSHEDQLTTLDKEVKAAVTQREEQLELLRDAMQTEKVKLSKLDKLLKHYRPP